MQRTLSGLRHFGSFRFRERWPEIQDHKAEEYQPPKGFDVFQKAHNPGEWQDRDDDAGKNGMRAPRITQTRNDKAHMDVKRDQREEGCTEKTAAAGRVVQSSKRREAEKKNGELGKQTQQV